MFHLFYLELRILVSVISTVWEDTGSSSKKYRCALSIYFMIVLSSSYVIIMYRKINAPGHENNIADGINAPNKCYLNKKGYNW